MLKTDDVIARAADEERLIQQAVQMQQSGDLPRADLIYQQILTRNPRHADALNLRGLLAYQAGQPNSALTLIKEALKVSPKNGQYFANLAFVQEIKGDVANAERSFKKAVKYQPNHAEAWNNYATLLQKQDRLDEAEVAYCEAIAKAPDYLQAYYNLGVMLINCGAYEKAASIFKQALLKMPDNPDLLLHYGVSLQGDGKLADASATYEKILKVATEHPSALVNLASVAYAEERMEDVRDFSKRALAVEPEHIGAWNNLGNAHLALGDYDLAESAYEFVLSKVPDEAEVHGNLANVFKNLSRMADAESHYRKALELDPTDARHQYQLSLFLQACGQYREAWPLFEAGFACGERYPDYSLATPRWTGQQLSEDEILHVWAEQGVGDELLMASLFADLTQKAPNCLIECDARLVDLFARSFPNAKVVAKGMVNAGNAHYQIPIGGLYEYLRNSLDDFPDQEGFLIPDPDKLAHWQQRVGELGEGLKIGIAWTSELKTARRQSALTELSDWAAVLSLPDCQFVDLQYGDHSDEILAMENKVGTKIHRWDDLNLKDGLDDVAALISALDIVITIGSSTHNLAGGIGVETWALLREPQGIVQGVDYLPTYPQMRLFTIAHDQNWGDILKMVSRAVACHSTG